MQTDVLLKTVIVRDDGMLLALRRSKTDNRRPNQWDLPGGMLDPGETLDEGAKREVKEETGLEVSVITPFYALSAPQAWEGGEANVVRIFFYATTKNDAVTISSEHSEYKWMTIDEAINSFEYERHISVLKYLKDNNLTF